MSQGAPDFARPELAVRGPSGLLLFPGGKLASLGPLRFLLKPDNCSPRCSGVMRPVRKQGGGASRAIGRPCKESGRGSGGRGGERAARELHWPWESTRVASGTSCKEKCPFTVFTSIRFILIPTPSPALGWKESCLEQEYFETVLQTCLALAL